MWPGSRVTPGWHSRRAWPSPACAAPGPPLMVTTHAGITQNPPNEKAEPGQAAGHYESFYLRGNDPARPLAFWLRYTIFAPAGRPDDALGELWAVVFDGETGRHISTKVEVPFAECAFSRTGFDVRVAGATLGASALRGRAGGRRFGFGLSGGPGGRFGGAGGCRIAPRVVGFPGGGQGPFL